MEHSVYISKLTSSRYIIYLYLVSIYLLELPCTYIVNILDPLLTLSFLYLELDLFIIFLVNLSLVSVHFVRCMMTLWIVFAFLVFFIPISNLINSIRLSKAYQNTCPPRRLFVITIGYPIFFNNFAKQSQRIYMWWSFKWLLLN